MAAKVLIVDDEAGFIQVVGSIAGQLVWKSSHSAAHAAPLGVFIDCMPDVLILDMVMPGKDGIDVLNDILSAGIPVQIVLTSGFGDAYLRLAESVAKYHGFEPVHILRKPFRRDQLIKLLKRLAGGQRTDGDAR